MKFTSNFNYESPRDYDILAGYGPEHRWKITYPWVIGHKPTEQEIDNFSMGFLNPGDAMMIRENLYQKHYNRTTFSSLVYKRD